jgi:hypothetical protein
LGRRARCNSRSHTFNDTELGFERRQPVSVLLLYRLQVLPELFDFLPQRLRGGVLRSGKGRRQQQRCRDDTQMYESRAGHAVSHTARIEARRRSSEQVGTRSCL